MKSTFWASAVAICAVMLVTAFDSRDASALTAEVARKCDAMVAKAFPPRVPGNPAAGSAKGSGRDQQAYFKKCVDNGGQLPDAGADPK
jgi:hypothetical protein